MFNKTIVIALLVCACYLGTIEARPGLTDVVSGPAGQIAGPLALGALTGGAGGIASSLPAQLTSALGQPGPLAQGLGGITG
ncbi:uncharacterized protein LOC6524256 [Drosophila yakuba]|uniref:Uncharacterized protein n=1 Tax=Drosophila yakuba TaxID=7245 RepID=B4Q075_DROYA|nr:uncharacterized protein LOC6524256 [Drosophila yakuba]EDX01227.1 uncharacterized protein Dyak_GE16336 [Drosophila yakuba]